MALNAYRVDTRKIVAEVDEQCKGWTFGTYPVYDWRLDFPEVAAKLGIPMPTQKPKEG